MAVASVAGIESGSWMMQRNGRKVEKKGRKRGSVSCAFSSSPPASFSYVADPYKTLRVRPGASESEVKKAFRQLALQYHPDVCRGSNCGVQFHQINEAYDIVMSNLRGEPVAPELYEYEEEGGEEMTTRGMDDPDWEMWEEWMGWEGAGTLDYTSHINPYI